MTRGWILPIMLALFAVGCDDGADGEPQADAAPADADPADIGPLDAAPDSAPDCEPGTDGCRCLMDQTCRLPGLACVDGRCLDPAENCDPAVQRCPPADPVCFTPCRGDLRAEDGSRRVCSSEGLMRGCLGDQICDRGACVPGDGVRKQAGPAPGTCAMEVDCPDHQTCILGRCYSDCLLEADCADGQTCHRQVCRQTCVATACDEGYACRDSVCLPIAEPGEPDPVDPGLAFHVDRGALAFTGSVPGATVQISNTGVGELSVTVRKAEQVTVDAQGREQRVDENPLTWLEMGVGPPGADAIAVEAVPEVRAQIAPGEAVILRLDGAETESHIRWSGRLAIEAEGLGTRYIGVSFSARPDGRWVGTAYSFANFPDGADPLRGEFPLEEWRADRSDTAPLQRVPNAFLQAWGGFRNGELGPDVMEALIDSTLTGSWDFPRVHRLCREAGFEAGTICAPFGGTGSRSVVPYSTTAKVPSGVVEMDFAMEIGGEAPADCGPDAHCIGGRIDSTTALQYAGEPALVLQFADAPTTCAPGGGLCTVTLDRFEATVGVSRRHAPLADPGGDGCPDGELRERPWLVPGFEPPGGGDDLRVDCERPAPAGAPGSRANPLPDGRDRVRRIELIDGVLTEQRVMSLLLRETVDPFHGGAPFDSYLYVVLEKVEDAPSAIEGNAFTPAEPVAADMGPRCSRELLQVVGFDAPTVDALDRAARDRLAVAVADGGEVRADDLPAAETVHSVCVWSEDAVLNQVGGFGDAERITESTRVRREVIDAGPDGGRPCFPGAEILYFTVQGPIDPAGWDCNRRSPEDCLTELSNRAAQGDALRFEARARTYITRPGGQTRFDLVGRCADPERAACDDDRFDLTVGKVFGVADGVDSFLSDLGREISRAFRYKLQFVDRIGGAEVGFAPAICRPGPRLDPYCYDPAAVAAVRDRLDCALALYTGDLEGRYQLGQVARSTLRRALTQAFSALQTDNPTGDPVVEYGFERLYAELLIMLGDDAYTAAFASRFDLAGAAALAFEGSRFEEGGVDLSGAAGYEMYKLYQAAQYYDLVLERFFRMSVILWDSLDAPAGERYVTAATVTTWLDRVIRASTRSASAWSEAARRYQALNRPDLARRVLVRAYTRAYQESLILRAFMKATGGIVDAAALPVIERAIDEAQLRYRVAMLDMQARFEQVGADIDIFGLPPGYLPFPALDEDDVNGFEVMLDRAVQRMELALEDEDAAIDARRDFDVDAASFRSELVTLRNSYEAELGELCGTFIGDDGQVRPAIARYSHLDEVLATYGDPCGAAGNGALWRAGADLQTLELELQRVRQEADNILSARVDARRQVASQCRLIQEDVAMFLETQGAVDGLEADSDRLQSTITRLDKVHDGITEFSARINDIADSELPWQAGVKAASLSVYTASFGINLIATANLEDQINVNQEQVRALERTYESYVLGRECDYLNAELVYTLRDLHRELLLVELDVLNAMWNVQVGFSDIQALANQRSRLEAEWRDNEQLAVDVAAAQSDPNIRIFKNDAIVNADRSFERALTEAWKATLMYEYYSAQSYADREALFLVRTVGRGDINLRRYLQDLEDDFLGFEQRFGNPDTRLAVISLRDDVLRIPRYADDGQVLSAQARIDRFRAALQDPARLDEDGALAIGFSTTFDQLSPLTTNHKILFIEVGLFGGEMGDGVGRVYLRQRGTGVVGGTDARRRFFTFPARTAVMNPFFNPGGGADDIRFGQDSDGAITGPTRSIYRSYRFRERPFVQTDWSLVIDQRNEEVNRDISLAGLDDVLIYVFYTDFTRDD